MGKCSVQVGLCWVIAFLSQSALARNVNVPTALFDIGFGFTTYKSEAVKSNDTSNSTGYTLSLTGGSRDQMNMLIRTDGNSTNFAYAKVTTTSSIKTSTQDTILRYRLGSFYAGLVYSQMDFNIVKEGDDYLDGLAKGNGFNVGAEFFLGRGNLVFFDVTLATGSTLKELKQSTDQVSIGNRTDIFIGGKIRITRNMFDLLGGYRQRSYAITVGSETYQEVLTTTWLGCAFNFYL